MNETILIIDDDEQVLYMFAAMCDLPHYTVLTALGGPAGVETYLRTRPAITFVDLWMPDKDGFQVLKEIRAQDPDAEVILMTSHDDRNTILAALRAYASDFVLKPVGLDVIDNILCRAQERLQVKRQLHAAQAALQASHANLEQQVVARTAELEAANRALRASEEKYRTLVDNLPDVVMRFDREGRHLYVNPQVEKMVGRPAGDFIGKTHHEMGFPPELVAYWEQAIQEVFASGEAAQRQFELEAPGGRMLLDWRLAPEFDDQGHVQTVLSISRDITEQRQAEAALRDSEERFRSIVESSPMGIYIYQLEDDDRLVLVGANPVADGLVGVDNTQFIGKTIEEAFPPLAETEAPTRYRRAARYGETWHSEQMNYDYGGIQGAFEVFAFRVSPDRVAVMFNDITARKQTEAALKSNYDLLDGLLESLPVGVLVWDAAGRLMHINPMVATLTGYLPEEIATLDDWFSKVYPDPAYRAQVQADWQAAIQLSNTMPQFIATREFRVTCRDDDVKDIEFRGAFLSDGRAAVTIVDITAHKRADEELANTKAMLQAAFEQSPVPMVLVSVPDAIIEIVNPACRKFLGIEDEPALNGTSLFNFTPSYQDFDIEGHPGQIADLSLARALRGEKTFNEERCIVRKDGATRWELVSGVPIYNAHGEILAGYLIMVDITARKQAEEALRVSEQRYRTIFETAGVAIWDEDFSELTAAWQSLQAQGVTDLRAYMQEHPEFLSQAAQMVKVIDVNATTVRMFGAASKEELLTSLDRILVPETLDILQEEILALAEGRGYFAGETINQTLDGRRLNVLLTMHTFSEPEKLSRVLVSLMDITELKHIEQQLRRHERLAAVGQLAAGIAHDFRNLLTTIILYAQLSLRKPGLPPQVAQSLDIIHGESKKAATLVQQILDFSSRAMVTLRPLDLAAGVAEIVATLRRMLPENIRITVTSDPEQDYTIAGDLGQIQQVLMNLALNSRDAMPTGGALHFTLSRLSVAPEDAPPVADMPPGAWVCLAVSDTGTGMSAAVMAHLFEPFFTTKEVGQGTGLGLAQVYGIIRQHQGYIGVTTAEGAGATFALYLPIVNAVPTKVTPLPAAPPGYGETILLVEDNDKLRAAGRNLLETLGYQVITAAHGREALNIYTAAENQIDLIITDIMMPEMDGKELLLALRQAVPRAKVVGVTGYAVQESLETLQQAGFLDVIHKPFDIETLAQVIRRALAAS